VPKGQVFIMSDETAQLINNPPPKDMSLKARFQRAWEELRGA